MFDPEAKPNVTAYTIDSTLIMVASEEVVGVRMVAGNQKVKDVAEHTASAAIILFHRPNLSARKPGTHLPIQLPALKIAMS